MSSSSLEAASTAVLRDVVVQGQLSLARPRGKAEPVPPAPVMNRTAAVLPDTGPSVSAAQALQEEAHRRGYEEGFAKGSAESRAQSAQEARQLAAQTAQRTARELEERAKHMAQDLAEKSTIEGRAQREALDALLRVLPAQIETRLEASQDDMLALCFETVCRVLGEEATRPEAVRSHLRHAMQALRGRRLVAVHLHPDDVAVVRRDADGEGAGLSGGEEVQWVGDPGVAMGGCILQSPQGGLDARFDTQLRALRELLLQSRAVARAET